MIKAKLVPLDSVLKDVYLLMNEDAVSEDLVMEFAIRGMEHLTVNQTFERAVCILPVVNNQASYPGGMYGIHAVLGNIIPTEDMTRYVVTSNTRLEVNVDESSFELIEDVDKTVIYKLLDFRSVNFAHSGWRYLALSNSAWDRSILCTSFDLGTRCEHWFIPDNTNNRFILSFDYGYIAVAYYRFPQNEKGQFLIPDNPLVHEALESYVLSKIYQRLWHTSTQGAQTKYQHYLEKWQQLAAAATGELMMLSLPDYINLNKNNSFFKDYAPTRAYGGWGHEKTNLR